MTRLYLQGYDLAETNYPVAMYHDLPLMQENRSDNVCKNCIPATLRILGIQQSLPIGGGYIAHAVYYNWEMINMYNSDS